MKDKLQLHEIAGYLPYGLKCQYQFISKITGYTELRIGAVLGLKQGLCEIQILINNKSNDPIWEKIDLNTKPILRPVSDLTKEITHNGKTFVPLVELFNIRYASGAYEIIETYSKETNSVLN